MLYVAFLKFKDSVSPENQRAALGRRAAYQYPEGVNLVAEYWPAGAIQVVSVFEADAFDPIFKVILDWQDVFQIDVNPAVTAEGGLQIGARLMGQAQG